MAWRSLKTFVKPHQGTISRGVAALERALLTRIRFKIERKTVQKNILPGFFA
jgi:hypothetical protein